jgi:hypothetical protein
MYTVEVYKRDARTKKGERLVKKVDHSTADRAALEHVYKHTYFPSHGYRFEIHETMVTRTNMMGGAEFQERYDTPYYCSPSSETYWSS